MVSISSEGIAAIYATASAITESVERVKNYTAEVRSLADEYQDTLGLNKAPLYNALSDIAESVQQASDPANSMAEMLNEVAEAYEEIFSFKNSSGK